MCRGRCFQKTKEGGTNQRREHQLGTISSRTGSAVCAQPCDVNPNKVLLLNTKFTFLDIKMTELSCPVLRAGQNSFPPPPLLLLPLSSSPTSSSLLVSLLLRPLLPPGGRRIQKKTEEKKKRMHDATSATQYERAGSDPCVVCTTW